MFGKVLYIWRYIIAICKVPLYNLYYARKGVRIKGLLINSKLSVSGKSHTIVIEKGTRLRNVSISITGKNNTLYIGRNTNFHESGRIRMEDENGEIYIGNNNCISDAFLTTADNNTKLIIGDNCLFSAGIVIRTSDSHSILSDLTGERINPGKSVWIGNNVWLGYGVTILKGSDIKHDSIIGTKSLVAGLHVPAHSLAAGQPAKIIKNNVSWDIKRR